MPVDITRTQDGISVLGYEALTGAPGWEVEGSALGVTSLGAEGDLDGPNAVGIGAFTYRRARMASSPDGTVIAFERRGPEEEWLTLWGHLDAPGELTRFSGEILDITALDDGAIVAAYRDLSPDAIPPRSEVRLRILAPGSTRLE